MEREDFTEQVADGSKQRVYYGLAERETGD